MNNHRVSLLVLYQQKRFDFRNNQVFHYIYYYIEIHLINVDVQKNLMYLLHLYQDEYRMLLINTNYYKLFSLIPFLMSKKTVNHH